MLARFRNPAAAALVCAGVFACVGGFVMHRMWALLPPNRCAELIVLAAFSIALAAALRHWRDWTWAHALAAVWCAAWLFFVGVPAVLATLLVAATALALGSLLPPRDMDARAALALPVGLVLVGGTLGWLLPLPIHRWYFYLPVLLAICIWRVRALREIVLAGRQGWDAAIAGAPWPAAAAVLVMGLASTGTWLPTMQADDLAYHLALPTQLLKHGFYALDPSQQIWALAPWLGDVLQGVAEVLARREARGAVDALWMVSIAASLWSLGASLGASMRTRWLVLALFASLPTVAALAAGMQTELAASALLVSLALAILRSRDHSLTWVCTVLVAGLAGLKFGQAFAAVVMLVWAFARSHGRIAWTRMPVAALLFIALAGSNYFYAWQVSGNPMLPLFNDIFRSSVLAPMQMGDLRWHAGFGVSLPWAITFDTEHYLEAWGGGFGFVLVALAGAWLLAVLRSETRGIALAASAILLLPMLPMQYARYGFPGLVLLLPALLMATDAAIGTRWCMRVVVGVCALNLAFQANANWLLHVNTVRKLVATGGRSDAVYRRYAPERALIAALLARDDSESVVLAMDAQVPDVAELGGRGRTVAHYAPKLETARIAADADASGARWQQLIRSLDARWLLLRPAHLNDTQRAALVLVGAQRVDTIGDAELWSVAGVPVAANASP